MKKQLIFSLLLCFAKTLAANGQSEIRYSRNPSKIEIERIYVLAGDSKPCEGASVDAQSLANYAEVVLLGEYEILERKHLDMVLEEQKLGMTGLVFEDQAVQAGCLQGSQGIVFCEVGCLSGQSTLKVKMVDCTESTQQWSVLGIEATPSNVMTALMDGIESGEQSLIQKEPKKVRIQAADQVASTLDVGTAEEDFANAIHPESKKSIWTNQGVASLTPRGVFLHRSGEMEQLTFQTSETDIAFICGYDDWLFVLRNSELNPGWDYDIDIQQLFLVSLTTGEEKRLDFKETMELKAEAMREGVTSMLNRVFYIDNEGSSKEEECALCTKIEGMAASNIQAGCTYPFLYITVFHGNFIYDSELTFRYDVINNEARFLTSAPGPRVIQRGPLSGNLSGTMSYLGKDGRTFRDVVMNSDGEVLKYIGGEMTYGAGQYDYDFDRLTEPNLKVCLQCSSKTNK